MQQQQSLLAIVEYGGYSNFAPLYQSFGYQVTVVNTLRKAVRLLKQLTPAVVVTEFNFQSDFRDRTSTVETLMSVLQRMGSCKIIVLYDKEHEPHFQKLRDRFRFDAELSFPVDETAMRTVLEGFALAHSCASSRQTE